MSNMGNLLRSRSMKGAYLSMQLCEGMGEWRDERISVETCNCFEDVFFLRIEARKIKWGSVSPEKIDSFIESLV